MRQAKLTAFSNLNVLTFRLIVLALPAQYLLLTCDGTRSAIPPGMIIAIISIAIFSVVVTPALRLKTTFAKTELATLIWFILLGSLIICVSQKTTSWRDDVTSFNIIFFPGMGVTIAIGAIWEGFSKTRFLLSFIGAVLLPYAFIVLPADLMKQAIYNLPIVYDGPLYRVCGMLDAGWNSWFAGLIAANQIFDDFEIDEYNYLPVWLAVAALLQQSRLPASRSYLPLSLFILGLVGFGLYYLMPAVGPLQYFGHLFPGALPTVQSVPDYAIKTASSAFRNAMPSLHASSAILAFLAVRECSTWQRSLGAVMVISTLFSTLGLGEHYVVDWVAAFPLVLFVRGLAAVYLPLTTRARQNAVAAGLLLEALWVVVVRASPYSLEFPDLIRAFAAASLIVPLILERQLARIERFERADPFADRVSQPSEQMWQEIT